jgi:hypothetical protein
MFNPPEKSYVFLPGTESHFNSFVPVANELISRGFKGQILQVEEFITNNRKFGNPNAIQIPINELIVSVSKWPKDVTIVVGNDSDWQISKILRLARKKGIKVVLMQDGWLDAANIKKPIYNSNGIIISIKKLIHIFLTQNWMPTKAYFHNLIGQNTDYFFVFSDVAKMNFIKAGVKSNKIFVTGSPRHLLLKRELKAESLINGKKAVVIFSTFIQNEYDSKITETGISWVLKKYQDQIIVIKLHPSENFEKYQHLISAKVLVQKCSLKEILSNYDIVLSFCFASTVVFDMLMLDIPILQLAPNGADKVRANYYKDLGIVRNKEELNYLIDNYDLNKTKDLSTNYLIDINPSFNSIEETASTLTKSNNK